MPLSRRRFVANVSAAGFASLSPFGWSFGGSPIRKGAIPASSTAGALHPLTPVPIERVTIEDAFWTPKRDVWRAVTVWDCLRKFEEQGSGVLANFDRVRDGLKGGHAGFPWHDGLVYETIRAACDFLRSAPDPELEARIDGIVARIVAAAAKDPGVYLNTYTQLEAPAQRWGLNGGLEVWQHEFYNLGALVDAGVHHFRATGRTTLLEAGVRAANTMAALVGPEPGRNLVPSHELPEEAMLGLYELLTERPELTARLPDADAARYLALAEFWIENRGRHAGAPEWEPDRVAAERAVRTYDYTRGRPSWGAYAQDDRPVFAQTTIEGHAVRATLLLSAVAATGRVNGRAPYRETAVRLWENMTERRMHVTGGVGAYAQEERFGEDYALPNDAYLETCAAVGAGFFHANMTRAFGTARYADELERVLYNGVLCGASLSGDRYTYQNPLVADESRERWEWHECPCCPPMFLKILGAMPGYVYATDADSAYVHLYVGGTGAMTVGETALTLRQTTEYPWDGRVRIGVEPEREATFGLMLRIPAWCEGARVTVNGERLPDPPRVRGYARIERAWRRGDVVELDLPMPARTVRAHPKVAANAGRAALARGPLVYCVESIDGVAPESVTLARRAKLTSERGPDRLGGVVAIRAATTDGARLTAVPFYANGNRGPARMAVWLPQQP